MTATRIEGPALPAITLEETKRRLRIDGNDDDQTLTELIASATDFIERDIGLALVTQTWRFYVDPLPVDHAVPVRPHPVRNVVSVMAYDRSGTAQEVSQDQYFFNTVTQPARLRFLASFDTTCADNGIEIDVIAGFGDSGADVPDSLKQALFALLAHWYEFRHAFAPEDQPVSVPGIYTKLTHPWRQVRVA